MAQTETLNILNLRCERFNPRLGQYDVTAGIPTSFLDEIAIHQFKGTTGGAFSVPLPPKQTSKVLWIRNDTNQQVTLTQPITDIILDADQGVMIFGGSDIWTNCLTGIGGGSGVSFFTQIAGDTIELTAPNHSIDCGTIKLNGDVTESSLDTGVLPPDASSAALPTQNQQYIGSIERGTLRNASQDIFQNIYGFPLSTENVYMGDRQIITPTGANTTIARRTGVTMAPGIIIAGTVATKSAFQDRALFDGLQIRGRLVGTSFIGVEIPAELSGGFFRFTISVEGNWTNTAGINQLRAFVRQYRGGVFLRDFNICYDDRSNGASREVCFTQTRLVAGQLAIGEDIIAGDEFEFYVENPIGSTNDFDLTLVQGAIEVARSS